ncbi:MAG: hypothetical protein EOL90_10420 [Spartobacteria bacterium]|nr:hypothetical protein [Spartobacteria bacterium]
MDESRRQFIRKPSLRWILFGFQQSHETKIGSGTNSEIRPLTRSIVRRQGRAGKAIGKPWNETGGNRKKKPGRENPKGA